MTTDPSQAVSAVDVVAWLDAMSALRKPTAPPNAMAGGALAVALEVATEAASEDTPVLFDAVLTGAPEAAILARSRTLKGMLERGETDAGLEYFKNSPADGCTSIIDLARIAAGYDPARLGVNDSLARFTRFATAILDAPVFRKRVLDVRPLRWETANWAAAMKQLAAQFPGLAGTDEQRLRASLERLARTAAGNPGRVQSGSVFVQNVLYANGKDFEVYLYYAYASFREIHEKKHNPKFVTDLRLARAHLSFLTAQWPGFAEAVWQRHVCAIVDWLDDNASRSDKAAPPLCFDT